MKKIIGILVTSSVLFFVMNSNLPYDIVLLKDSHASWFFFKKDEPVEKNFVRIQLPIRVLNGLGTLKAGSDTRPIESDIEKINKALNVKVVTVANMITIYFNHKDDPSKMHKLLANKLSLYRLALSKPDENYGPIVDNIAVSNEHIAFLEFDREGDNIFFQWPILSEEEKANLGITETTKVALNNTPQNSDNSTIAIPVPVPVAVPVLVPAPENIGGDLYEQEYGETLKLQKRLAEIIKAINGQDKKRVREIDASLNIVEDINDPYKDPYDELLRGKASYIEKYENVRNEKKVVKESETENVIVVPVPVVMSLTGAAVAGEVAAIIEPAPPKKKGGVNTKALDLYNIEHEKTLILHEIIAGIDAESKDKERKYLEEAKELKEVIHKFKEIIYEIKKKHGNLESEKEELSIRLEASDLKIKELRKEKRKLSKRVAEFEERIKDSRHENERSLKVELQKYDTQLTKLKMSHDILEDKFADYIIEVKEGKHDGTAEITALKQKLHDFKKENVRLKKEFDKYAEATKNKLEKEYAPLLKENKKIVEEMTRKAEQQKRIMQLSHKEEKKKLKAELNKALLDKGKAWVELQKQEMKLAGFLKKETELKAKRKSVSERERTGEELKAKLEVEMKKTLENMIKGELTKGIVSSDDTSLKLNESTSTKSQAKLQKKETPLEVLRQKLYEATRAKSYAEYLANVSIEQNKEFEDMIIEDLLMSMGTPKNAVASNIETDNRKMILTIMRGDHDKVKELLDESDYYDLDRCLKFAVLKGNINIVELLLDNGAVVNNEIFNYAAGGESLEIVELLYKFEAIDINAVNNYCVTPIMKAAFTGDPKVVRFLIENGAEVDGAFITSVKIGRLEMAGLLLDNGADVNTMTDGGNSALILAVDSGYIELTKLLLDHYADVNVKNDKGKTALMLAKEKGHTDIVELLKDAAAKL